MVKEGKRLLIDADVQAVLEKRGIREEDIQEVLDFGEETGNVYMHPDTGHLLSYFTPATTTYWVEFGRDGGAYRIYRAYSHRMEILHGFNMPAKKQQTLDWTCTKCDRRLELATVKLKYMEETFGVDIPACPSCQRIFVSEEDATQRMAQAEKMLEDK
ncbi:MAG TPA: hypothetical protein PKJ17_10685 [Syntrophorhabdaceae bacterium]|jgi:hypothetical protein|nr:hypothetical protein [Syntrophorhabdaceae bacterium]